MRRWNGWGDDATTMELNAGTRAMLGERLGPADPLGRYNPPCSPSERVT